MNRLLEMGSIGALAPASGEHNVTSLLFMLLVLFAAAKLGAELFERLKQPAVVGEILAGIVVGPQLLKLVAPNEVTFALSELGVLFLLFLVGLETKPSDLLRVGKEALFVAAGGVILPFILAVVLMLSRGETIPTSLFVGAALVATSVGITAQVLERMGVLHALSSRIILGAAVLDDILGLLVLAVVSGFARPGGVDYRQLALTALYAVAFVVFMLFYGGSVVARARPALERLRIGHSLYLAAIALCLFLSVTAGYLGVAAIIGAFLAGVAFSEASEETGLQRRFESLSEFFTPFFLAGIGMQLDVRSLANGSVLRLCILLVLLAIVGKVIGCGLPLRRRSRRMALQVGVGMVPRGEVGIIVAQLGLGLGVLRSELFAAVLFMAVATTMVAPPVLARLYVHEAKLPEDARTDETEIDIS
ncbi:MAG TPA: cation:proton antiporter [Armatimonadota bacterium]|nr:cation:proton antiporter [Armatimonadota bacterium]